VAPLFKRSLGKIFQGKSKPQVAEIFLAAFGKHPGWDDHIEDLGLETERLIHVRRTLYVQGIAGNIDSGTWEQRAEEERLEGFDHAFIWTFPGELVLGRMWSSRDGKGRTRYPMVVCAECRGVPLDWALRHVLPRLDELHARCTQTTAAEDVRSAIAQTRQSLRNEAQGLEPTAQPIAPSPRALARLADSPEMAPERQGMHRVLYQIRREMAAFVRGGAEGTATALSTLRAAQMRVPLCAPNPREAFSLWLRFLFAKLDPSTPVLALARLDSDFLDIIAGDPAVQHLFCVRASTEAVPLTSEIPYNLDPAFVAEAEKEIDDSRGGPPPPRPPAPEPPPPTKPTQPPTRLAPSTPKKAPPHRPPPGPMPPPQQPQPPAPQLSTPAPAATPTTADVAPPPEEAFAAPGPVVAPRRFPKLLALLVAVAVLVVGGLVAFPFLSHLVKPSKPPPRPIEWKPEHAEAWSALCRAYDGWFGRLEHEATRRRLKAWRKDPALAEGVVGPLENAKDLVLDPREIIGQPAADLEALADNPPERARMNDTVERTSQALQVVIAIQQTLARWPAEGPAAPQQLISTFEKNGWKHHAAVIRAAIEALEPAAGKPIADAIDRMLALREKLGAIRKLLDAEAAREKELEAVSPKLAAAIHDTLLAEGAKAEDLDRLRTTLETSVEAIADLAATCRRLEEHRATVRKLAGEELDEKVKSLIAAAIEKPQPLSQLVLAAKRLEGAAAAIARGLEGLDGLCRQVAEATGAPVAARLRDLAVAQVRSAHSLSGMSQRIESIGKGATEVRKAASRLKAQGEALSWLGQETAARRAQRLSREVAQANSVSELAAVLAHEARLADQTASALESLLRHQQTVVKSGDKVLVEFGKHALAKARAVKNLEELPAALEALGATAAKLAAFVQNDLLAGKIDRDRFTRQSKVHTTFDGNFTEATLRAWRSEVELYRKLDPAADPRPEPAAVAKALDDLQWRITFLKEAPEEKKKALGRQCGATLEGIAKAHKSLAALPWIAKNKATIEARARDLNESLHSLQKSLQDVIEPPQRWLARVRSNEPLTTSREINAEWARRRDALVPPGTSAEKLLENPRAYTKLWRNVRTLRQFLKALDDPQELPTKLPTAAQKASDSTLRDAFQKKVAERREKALRQIIASIPWSEEKTPSGAIADFKASQSWQRPRDAYRQWLSLASSALAATADLKRQLDAGYLPDHKPPGAAKTGRQLRDHLRTAGIPDDLVALVEPQLDRVNGLLAIRGLPREKLVAMAKAPDRLPAPQGPMVLWLRLGELDDWPASLDELNLELALRKRVEKLAAAVRKSHPQAVAWVPQALVAQNATRWGRCFRKLVAAAKSDSLADPAITACMRLAPQFEIVFENMPADIRFAKELYDFRQKAATIPADAPKKTVDHAVGDFLQRLSTLPGGPPTCAKGLAADLQALLKQKVVEDPTAGLEKAGPVAGALADHWKVEIEEGGRLVVFSWPDYAHTVAFRRVEPKSRTARAAYLCTTETSVGLFIDTLRATNTWSALAGVLERYERHMAPKGPRTWQWGRRAGAVLRIERPRRWLADPRLPQQGRYPEGLDPGSPRNEHPIQYVSAPAALLVAWLLGCRLPSEAEWLAAYGATQQPARGANLRDAIWKRQLRHMAQRQTAGNAFQWPDAGIFLPPKASSARLGERAAPVTDDNDGAVWFRPVGTGTTFQNLVGNVAEFVLDAPRDFDKRCTALRAGKATAAAAYFLKLLKENPDALRVIGASALSPPELWDGNKRPFTTAWPVELTKNGWDSFSDVGFRLAFTAPRETPSDQLRRILARWGYPSGR